MSSALHGYYCKFIVTCFLATSMGVVCFCQPKKSPILDTFFLAKKKGIWGKLGRSVSIGTPADTIGATINNVDPFLAYKNYKINSIKVINITFGGSVNDTSTIRKTFFLRLADDLHVATKERIIKNNLFFKKGDLLFPNLVADNERFLRDLSYIQDARILVSPTANDTNLVDVVVVYKDVFSISGTGSGTPTNAFLELKEDNFMGQAQRIIAQQYYDFDRNGKYGLGLQYTKRNIKGTFLDLTLGYSNITPAFNSGRREETMLYTRLDLPLVSPYFLWTGSVEASIHYTTNRYLNDSTFLNNFNYKYNLLDAWGGYNISGKLATDEGTIRKVRQFLAVRVTEKKFYETPEIYHDKYVYQYANLTSILAAYTIFKQEYYRTNFLYGFGRNEDIPEGFNYSIIAGWADRSDVARPYLGFDLQRNYFTSRKSYFNYTLRMGSYFNTNQLQDIGMVLGVESFTKLRKLGNSKWFTRHFLNGSISQQFKRTLDEPIQLNSVFGIEEFNSDSSTLATTRITVGCTSVFYNTWKLSGFSFAPFVFANVSYLKPLGYTFLKGDGYASVGAGIRSRNENLIFGTMELKAFYYPRTTTNMNPWNVTLSTDLRFKYNSQYIKRPEFVSLN